MSKLRPKISPIGLLTKNERRVFDHTVRENGHLKRADVPLLEIYSIAFCRAIAARKKNSQFWDREARALLAIATKLRITPQATTEAKTAARRRAEQPASYYDRMAEENE